jgi:hypothetical protein
VIDGKQSGADEDGELAIALYRNDEIPTMAAPAASVLANSNSSTGSFSIHP